MLKKIVLNPCDLAKITGHNKFEPIEVYIEKLLSKSGIIKKYIPNSNVERSLLGCDADKLNKTKNQLNLKSSATIKDIQKKIDIMKSTSLTESTEEKSKQELIKSLKNKPNIKEFLKDSIEKDTRMRRGNIKEDKALDKTQDKLDIKIKERNMKFYTKMLFKTDKCSVEMLGKVDGISEDGKLVETKNRRKKLFNIIPEYEKVQIEAYMFLTGLTECIHIENYNEDQGIKEYKHNEEFWQECLTSMEDFIKGSVEIHL